MGSGGVGGFDRAHLEPLSGILPEVFMYTMSGGGWTFAYHSLRNGEWHLGDLTAQGGGGEHDLHSPN